MLRRWQDCDNQPRGREQGISITMVTYNVSVQFYGIHLGLKYYLK